MLAELSNLVSDIACNERCMKSQIFHIHKNIMHERKKKIRSTWIMENFPTYLEYCKKCLQSVKVKDG